MIYSVRHRMKQRNPDAFSHEQHQEAKVKAGHTMLYRPTHTSARKRDHSSDDGDDDNARLEADIRRVLNEFANSKCKELVFPDTMSSFARR